MKISRLLNKIELAAGTYYHAINAISNQNNPEKIIELRNKKLQNIINYSIKNIKYYQELFKREGIEPNQIKTQEDLNKIPILTKIQLRERFWDFLPRTLPESRVSRTSGSTGIPICILSDNNSRMFNSAAVIRYRRALGIGFIGRPILTLLKTSKEPYLKEEHWTYLQGIHKTYYINPYVESSENTKHAIELLNKLKKPALIGITPAIRALAYKVRDGVFPSFKPCIILTTGESLSLQVRTLIENTFNTKVSDIYACNEAGDIAWQCRYGDRYHINADNVIVEIIKNGQPVENDHVGEVVITNLNRFTMPIIRYRNGDLARFSHKSCPCGCKLPMIAEIIGRTGEDIILPNGKTISWNQLKSPMNHPQIRQFQLIQNDDGSLTVSYVAEYNANIKNIENLLLMRYREITGPLIRIEMKKTKKISLATSGKSKLVISNYNGAAIQS